MPETPTCTRCSGRRWTIQEDDGCTIMTRCECAMPCAVCSVDFDVAACPACHQPHPSRPTGEPTP